MQTRKIEPWLEWKRLCEALGINVANMQLGFQQLAVSYGESLRKYHTLFHIQDCLEQFAWLRDACDHPLAVELALWWHDSVYEPMRMGNEEASAKRMVEFATRAGVDRKTIEIARACVLATKHNAEPTTRDEQVMVDVDLSILGREWNVYEAYTHQIREEYKAVMRLIYMLRRKSIMRSFLDRKRIFSTLLFYDRYESQARANIAREIS